MFENMSLTEARAWVVQNSKGTHCECPCCGKRVRLFRRPLNRGMVISLMYIIGRWLHSPEPVDMRPSASNPIPRIVAKSHGDYMKLVYWDLITIEYRDVGLDKKKVGFVKPTQKGLDFADEKLGVPGHIFIRAGKFISFDDTSTVWLSHVLTVSFNFDEMMASFDDKVTSPERAHHGDFEEGAE